VIYAAQQVAIQVAELGADGVDLSKDIGVGG